MFSKKLPLLIFFGVTVFANVHAADMGEEAEEKTRLEGDLFYAATVDNLARVKDLISQCADVDKQDENGVTPLMFAASWGHLRVVEYLVGECGADVDVKNRDGETALMWAALRGRTEVVEHLAGECGVDVDAGSKRRFTALMMAAKGGYLGTARVLISNKANIDAQNDANGMSALGCAAYWGHLSVVKLLLAGGADASLKDKEDLTALEIAKGKCHDDVVECLAERE